MLWFLGLESRRSAKWLAGVSVSKEFTLLIELHINLIGRYDYFMEHEGFQRKTLDGSWPSSLSDGGRGSWQHISY